MISKHEVGQRVVAIRDSKDGVVNIFGFGTFEGNAAMPGLGGIDSDWLRVMRETLAKEVAKPLEEVLQFCRDMEQVMAGLVPDYQPKSDEALLAQVQATRAEHQAVLDGDDDNLRRFMLSRGIGTNPRIRITEGENTGRAVWGMECWWGDAEGFEEKYANHTVNVVPLTREPYPEDDAEVVQSVAV